MRLLFLTNLLIASHSVLSSGILARDGGHIPVTSKETQFILEAKPVLMHIQRAVAPYDLRHLWT